MCSYRAVEIFRVRRFDPFCRTDMAEVLSVNVRRAQRLASLPPAAQKRPAQGDRKHVLAPVAQPLPRSNKVQFFVPGSVTVAVMGSQPSPRTDYPRPLNMLTVQWAESLQSDGFTALAICPCTYPSGAWH